MRDLATALALVLVLEGLVWAAAPGMMKRAASQVLQSEESLLRLLGLATACAGVVGVWLIRA